VNSYSCPRRSYSHSWFHMQGHLLARLTPSKRYVWNPRFFFFRTLWNAKIDHLNLSSVICRERNKIPMNETRMLLETHVYANINNLFSETPLRNWALENTSLLVFLHFFYLLLSSLVYYDLQFSDTHSLLLKPNWLIDELSYNNTMPI
jgi:hypothetical protein